MNIEQLWDVFASSGRIDDYLTYISKKESLNDNT